MDVKLVSELPFVFPFSFYPCMWTFVFFFFLLHPVCVSQHYHCFVWLYLYGFLWLSHVNLVRGRTLQTIWCVAALCGGEERLLHTQAALSPAQWAEQPPALSPPWGSSHTSAGRVVLLTVVGVAVETVGLLSCVRRSWHKEPPSGLNSELSVKSKWQNHSMVFVLFTITIHIAHPRKILRLF